MRMARPSTTAVFPTPGGPTRQALFLRLRSRIWMIRSISSCRPTTGSSKPSNAICVRSVATSSSVMSDSLDSSAPTAASCRSGAPGADAASETASRRALPESPRPASILAPPLWASLSSPRARSSCSQPTSVLPTVPSFAVSNSSLAFSLNGREPDPEVSDTGFGLVAMKRFKASRVTPFRTKAVLAMRLAPFCSSEKIPKMMSSVETTP
mmetsp:Transcript_58007/g.135771  ORF Transcript_58007/g.135771 Transcript_58007/m.135771 type:complete len:210 (-) Transcript_58007:261-890(-)